MTGKKDNKLAQKIERAMKEAGFTQRELAKVMGITNPTISTWTTGKRNPTVNTLKRIAQATGKPLNYFFENSPVGDGNQIINGNHNQMSSDKDYALILAKIATLESKVENLELKYELLKTKNN